MEIYSFKLKSKTNANVFICLTNIGEFQMHSDIIVKFSIKVGEIDESKFNDAIEESSKLIAFNLATKYVGSRLKTEQQIKDLIEADNEFDNENEMGWVILFR